MKRFILTFMALLVIGLVGYTIYVKEFSGADKHYVILDINPSIQLELNSKNVVTDVIPLNADADVLLSDLKLLGSEAIDATSTIVNEAIELGYIDEYDEDNVVNIQSTLEDENVRNQLQTRIADRINTELNNKKVYALVVAGGITDEMKEKALEYGISNGKYLLVNKALTLNPALSEEELATSSVQDIQKYIKEVVTERREAISTNVEEAKTLLVTEKERVLTNYQAKVQEMKETLLQEYKNQTSTMPPMRDDVLTGELLEKKKDKIKEYVNKVKEKLEETELTTNAQSSSNGQNTTVDSTLNNISTNVIRRVQEEVKQKINNE